MDGLRAISILLVLLGHSSGTYEHHNHWVNFLLTIVGNADLGVLIFFVISGFLITTLLLKEHGKTGTISLPHFYLRRAFRIFPAFYCYMSVIFCLWITGVIRLTWPVFLSAALFLRDYSVVVVHSYPKGDWFVGHTWTLSVEEQFYWLWPLILILFKPRRAVAIVITLILIDPILRVGQYFTMPSTREQIPIMLHTRMDSLMFGSLIALLYTNSRFQAMLQRLYRYHLPLVAAIFMFFLSPILASHYRGIYLLPIGWPLENSGAALILLWAIDHSQSKLGALLNSRILVHIGVISYSLYLWQQLFLTKLNPLMFDVFPVNLVLALIAAEISYFFIERPTLSLRQRVIR